MKCVVCEHGEMQPWKMIVALERDGMTRVLKSAPAQICEKCGEGYLSEDIMVRFLRQASDLRKEV